MNYNYEGRRVWDCNVSKLIIEAHNGKIWAESIKVRVVSLVFFAGGIDRTVQIPQIVTNDDN